MFPMIYEHYLHIKNEAVPVTGRGGLYVSFLCGTNINIFYIITIVYLNSGQPRTLLQLNLVEILKINLFLIKTKLHPTSTYKKAKLSP
jgi:hypothetical protein